MQNLSPSLDQLSLRVGLLGLSLVVLASACGGSDPASSVAAKAVADGVIADGAGFDADAAVGQDAMAPDAAIDAAETSQDGSGEPAKCASDNDCPVTGNPCTTAICAVGGVCKQVPGSSAAPCTDGNACTIADLCVGGACQPGAEKSCDDKNPCTVDSCQPADGNCSHTPTNGGPCDDGTPCTLEDSCLAGVCKGPINLCSCQVSSDCQGAEDGNLCNGTLYCDTASFPYTCKVNPASVVVCSSSGVDACQQNTCDPKTGKCAVGPSSDGIACDDDNACTEGDQCKAGQCSPGTDICACQTDVQCAEEDDGDQCNGVWFCNKALGKCAFNLASVVSCPTVEDTLCRKNLCQPLSGDCVLTDVNIGKPCVDGNPCTVGEVCEAGACKGGTDTCKCTADADCAAEEDGDACNGELFCNKQSGKCELNPATVVSCPVVDNTFCAANLCNPKTGACVMTPQHDKDACDDGDPCTVGDTCAAGQCVPSANTCLCTQDADCAGKEDGNLCNGKLFCNKQTGGCELNPATVVVCPTVKDSACAKATCVPTTGACALAAMPTATVCDADGNSCTVGDSCDGKGGCAPGPKVCECQLDADCAAKEDGDLCNGTLFCDKSGAAPKCAVNPKTVVTCPSADDTACQVNTCAAKTGLCAPATVNVNGPCDDGDACTIGDTCDAKGGCVSGKDVCFCKLDVECAAKDDGNLCNGTYFCNKAKVPFQCALLPSSVPPEGFGCDDGNPCTQSDACKSGLCVGVDISKIACNDGNVCTADLCSPATSKCESKPLSLGLCDDGNACTSASACTEGTCVATVLQVCNDSNACTLDSCNPASGCIFASKPLGSVCGSAKTCTGDPVAPTCSCGTGFEPNAIGDCIDTDECKKPGVCPAGTQCVNTLGSYTCTCLPGYEGKDGVCNDIDECATGTAGCKAPAVCKNLPGSFECTCAVGQMPTPDKSCVEVDECKQTVLSTFGAVTLVSAQQTHGLLHFSDVAWIKPTGGYEALCQSVASFLPQGPLWQPQGAGYRFADAAGDLAWPVSFGGGAFACNSLRFPTFWPQTDLTTIKVRVASDLPVGEVAPMGVPRVAVIRALALDPAPQASGPQIEALGNVKFDLQELAQSGDAGKEFELKLLGAKGLVAELLIGLSWSGLQSPNPSAYKGFRVLSVTIDGAQRCDPAAICIDKSGGALPSCTCPKGYGGTGNQCLDVDECIDAQQNPCWLLGPDAMCINTPGSYTCGCLPGSKLSGGICVDIDHCADNNGGCGSEAVCVNLAKATGAVCDCKVDDHVWIQQDGGTCIPDRATWSTKALTPALKTQADGTLADSVSGLEWSGGPVLTGIEAIASGQDQINAIATWLADQKYCDELAIGAKADWRLPTPSEMLFMAQVTDGNWAFSDWSTSNWSFTTSGFLPTLASAIVPVGVSSQWTVGYQGAARSRVCVRGTPAQPVGARFSSLVAGIVDDAWTGLGWQTAWSPSALTIDAAATYCQNLTLGSGGWRVPTAREYLSLLSFANLNPWLPPGWQTLVSGKAVSLWTASALGPQVLAVDSAQGEFNRGLKTVTKAAVLPVRCVRGAAK